MKCRFTADNILNKTFSCVVDHKSHIFWTSWNVNRPSSSIIGRDRNSSNSILIWSHYAPCTITPTLLTAIFMIYRYPMRSRVNLILANRCQKWAIRLIYITNCLQYRPHNLRPDFKKYLQMCLLFQSRNKNLDQITRKDGLFYSFAYQP